MSSSSVNPAVLVGTDGSDSASDAVRWAAVAAARHGAPLRIVCAIDIPVEYGPGVALGQIDYESYRQTAAANVAAARESAAAAAAPIRSIDIETTVVQEHPIPLLRDLSEHARLLVVGTHGRGALRRWLLGSVSTSLTRQAHCPVAVIPPARELEPDRSHGPVVVGVDGSRGSELALDVAFDEAARRDAELVAVLTWSEFYRYIPRAEMQNEAEELLARTTAGYAEKYPEVEVRRVVVEDSPAERILAAAEHAQLIVVGSHGRGGFPGMTLGSVGNAVLHAAECPVVIARGR
ncbi:universal stress protein [Nocardia bovistercoris]|uniref:Universal stress protein n=1 Tax=Nocardia bovistercoris TaxID=2785916 RepID=A0A931N6Z3_9NOCA|nr:universal stress protein [Nocardia bovistercoris]MBH0781056.1 universal stress protein [Nocardia bovistercoris]